MNPIYLRTNGGIGTTLVSFWIALSIGDVNTNSKIIGLSNPYGQAEDNSMVPGYVAMDVFLVCMKKEDKISWGCPARTLAFTWFYRSGRMYTRKVNNACI